MTTTTAADVAAYINTQTRVTGRVQLQKLLYYVQAWSLAWDGSPIFDDEIEAWEKGPVVRAVYDGHRGDISRVSEDARRTVDAVLKFYGRFYGSALIERTHSEKPWQESWTELPEYARGNQPITHASMRRFYTEQALTGDCPVRPSPHEPADMDAVLKLASRNANRWRETLQLLAQ